MKRNIVIATVTAAALVGGGTASAVAFSGSGDDRAPAKTASQSAPAATDDRGADDDGTDDDGPDDRAGARDDDGRDDDGVRDDDGTRDDDGGRDDDSRSDAARAGAAKVTLDEAAKAATAAVPGTVASVDLDDDARLNWDVDILGKDGKWHDLTIDAGTAKVLNQHVDRDEDTNASALRSADVSAVQAAHYAASKGTVTSVDFDDDRGASWEVEVVGKNGHDQDWAVSPQTGKVTTPPADDDDNDDNDSDD